MSLATSNIFSALDTKKKKKSSKTSKDPGEKKRKAAPKPDRKTILRGQCRSFELQQQLFSGQAKAAVSNWADTDEEDDFEDDIGPLPQSWLPTAPANGAAEHKEEDGTDSDEAAGVEEIHQALGLEPSRDDDDEPEDEDDEQAAEVGEASTEALEPHTAHAASAPVHERQLSKKEQKKREIEEMNRVLAELGIETPAAPASEKSRVGPSGAAEKAIPVDENAANGTEIAAGKKKKRKDKEKKAVPTQEEPTGQSQSSHEPEVEQPATMDPAEAKKLLARKTAAANAKKSSNSAAATLAAKEAKERAAKKAKIRDKKNYNQAPTR